MSDTSTNTHWNKLSATALEQRENDIKIQKRASEILKRKLGNNILEVSTFRDDITITIAPQHLRKVVEELKNNEELQFDHMSSVTGIDYSRYNYPESWGDIRFGVVYNAFSYPNSANFTIRVVVPEEEAEVPSVFDLWHGVDWQEREVYDLIGVSFSGHPDPRRILLYDDFEGEHPLRKDYPLRGKGERDRTWKRVQAQARVEEE